MLHFNTGDRVTDSNLSILDHLARPSQVTDYAEHMQQWLVSAIDTVDMLPAAFRNEVRINFYIGDAHFRWTQERRSAEWMKMIAELRDALDRISCDATLKARSEDRPKSLGEEIIELCDKLSTKMHGSTDFKSIVAELVRISKYQARNDALELQRLSQKRRVDQFELVQVTDHLRTVATRLHNMKNE